MPKVAVTQHYVDIGEKQMENIQSKKQKYFSILDLSEILLLIRQLF